MDTSSIITSKSPPLKGSVRISGAKNSALPILAATILCDGKSVLCDVPELSDISYMKDLLGCFGVKFQSSANQMVIESTKIIGGVAPYELVSKLRASFLIMGPLLAKTGKVQISTPGGCAIGTRPVDLHLKGFVAMGAKITCEHGYIRAKAPKLEGAKIYLDFPSVGATENILMAATLAKGQTIIENAAIEPEIVDLANFLCKAGASIKGAGTDTIKITGVENLNGTSHAIIPDRVEAGTFMVAAALTHGIVDIQNIVPDHLKPISAKLREIGVTIGENENSILVDGSGKFKSTDIKTLPFPGFPTDMQAQFSSLLSITDGTSIIIETIFENRFMHLGELCRMGANIKIEGRTAIIEGKKGLSGATVTATDLRAGAALVLAGLVAEGQTKIENAFLIERGYHNFDAKLKSIGANIQKT